MENISFSYGPVQALDGVSLELNQGELVCLLGANGAGKTTLLSLLSGLTRPKSGQVTYQGQIISGMKPSKVVRAGVVHVPEGRQLFGPLTVKENLELGAITRKGDPGGVARDLDRVMEMFPILAERSRQLAGTLSGGEQQMVAIARGLMASPKVLLLDEPSLGLAPLVTREIFQIIRELPGQGTSVLVVEQNALAALSVAQRGYVLTNGRIRASGTSKDIFKDKLLREAFLGPERII